MSNNEYSIIIKFQIVYSKPDFHSKNTIGNVAYGLCNIAYEF